MPTIFERIESGLSGNDVSVRLSGQVSKLGTITSTVTGLIEHPPQGVQELLSSLSALPLPDIQVGGDLQGTLTSLQGALPTDLSSVTGDLTEKFEQLAATVAGDLVKAVAEGIGPVLDLAKLLQLDPTCAAGGAGATGGPSGTGGAGASSAGAGGTGAGAGGSPPPSGVASTVDTISSVLDGIPAPLTIDVVLAFLAGMLDVPSREAVAPFPIPLVDEVRESLATLVAWNAMTSTQLRTSIRDALNGLLALVRGAVDAPFGSLSGDLSTLGGQLQSDTLLLIADGLIARLGELKAAVDAGDLSGTAPSVAAITALLDQYDAARVALQPVLGQLGGVAARVEALPGAIDGHVGHAVSVVSPAGSLPISFPGPGQLEAIDPAFADDIDEVLSPVVAWLQDLLAKLDLSAIQAPIQAAADKARAAVDEVDSALASVTSQVQGLFAQVESLIDGVDIDAITDEVKASIDGFRQQLVQQLDALFSPVKDVVGQAVAAIDQAVAAFDPADIVDALRDVVSKLAGILDDPEVKAALQQISGALDTATGQLKTLSFSPVTEEVIGVIDEITTALQAIDSSMLSVPLQLALQGAVALLPQDLTPVTDPLVVDFGALVEAGPGALAVTVKAPVAQLQDQVLHFEPASLIGDALSAPFQQVIGQMQAFQPGKLLDPVNQELAALKERLKQNASPGRLLEPLEGPFDDLLQAFDRFKPEDIVKSLDDALKEVVDSVLAAVPIEDVLKPVGDVLARIQAVADIGTKAVSILHKAHDLLEALEDGPTQFATWLNGVLDKVEAIGSTTSIQTVLGDVATAVDATTAQAIQARAAAAIEPLITGLDGLDARASHASIVRAWRGVSAPALAALPDSPERAAVSQVLARSDPLKPDFAQAFEALAAFGDRLGRAEDALSVTLSDWDVRYHDTDGPLVCLGALQATPANLRAWVQTAVDRQVVPPVRMLLALIAPVATLIEPVARQAEALVTDLTGKLTSLLTGPGSVGAIKAAVDGLIQRLRDFDLGFLTDSLSDLFGHVRQKVEAIGPSALRAIVDQAFDDMLGTLDVGQVLSPDDVTKLNDDYAKVVAKLQQLDPKTLVVDAVQPQFDEKILPLVKTFDLSALLDAVTQMLTGLKGQLQQELDKVNEAYKRMLAAVPSINPLSISVDVADVGAAVGGLF